ncbi:MAG: type II toxin-antitoxin system RelE/ParE family toxin, partial [Stenotrophobium sp.]
TFEWYELKKPGSEFEFIGEVEAVYAKLCEHPLNYSAISQHFRKIKIHRFPYLVIYEMENNEIFITAITHVKRKSKPNPQ